MRPFDHGRLESTRPHQSAGVQAVLEAVLNALVVNEDMVGRDGHRSPRLQHERLSALLGLGT